MATMGLWAPCAGALRLGRCCSGGCCPPALPTPWAETQELRVRGRTWPLEGLHADGFTSPVTAGSLIPPQRPGLHRLQATKPRAVSCSTSLAAAKMPPHLAF